MLPVVSASASGIRLDGGVGGPGSTAQEGLAWLGQVAPFSGLSAPLLQVREGAAVWRDDVCDVPGFSAPLLQVRTGAAVRCV